MIRFEEDLENLAKGLSQPRKTKKHTKVLERIGRLKEKHKRISECYEIEVIASELYVSAGSTNNSLPMENFAEHYDGSSKGHHAS